MCCTLVNIFTFLDVFFYGVTVKNALGHFLAQCSLGSEVCRFFMGIPQISFGRKYQVLTVHYKKVTCLFPTLKVHLIIKGILANITPILIRQMWKMFSLKNMAMYILYNFLDFMKNGVFFKVQDN